MSDNYERNRQTDAWHAETWRRQEERLQIWQHWEDTQAARRRQDPVLQLPIPAPLNTLSSVKTVDGGMLENYLKTNGSIR